MKFVTVKTFDNSIDAHLFRIKLEAEGVEVFIRDEQTVTMNPLYSNAIGGIKVQIRENDLDKVKHILQEEQISNTILCPKCGSKDVITNYRSMKSFSGIIAAIISFATTTYPLFYKSTYKCKVCGNEWTSEKEFS